MSKRSREPEDGQRPAKRPKGEKKTSAISTEPITSARQLQQLLSFRQDGIDTLRGGIASFKAFLEQILYHEDPDDRGRQLAILQEFLDSQKPADASIPVSDAPFLNQLWQAWSFAAQEPNDALVSAVAAILALVLKTLSSTLQLKDCGLRLCRTVLLPAHVRLIKRCLAAPKQKEHLISPCLRLLTEVLGFDGGVLARELYKRRDDTFDVATLKRHLSATKTDVPTEDLYRRPAIRTLTVRYILGFLKYLHEGGKVEILKNRYLCTSLFNHISDDPIDVISELLFVSEQHVFKDDNLPRSAKASLLAQQNLQRVTELLSRSQNPDDPIVQKALTWIKAVITTPSYGVLRRGGWYPPRTTHLEIDHGVATTINLGLDGLDFYDSDDPPEVRNTILLGWSKFLRPQSHALERDLLLTLFQAAPELVAAYFWKSNLLLEPKLSNTWIGYASFLFEVVCLPEPERFGNDHHWASLPPQTTIMVENLIPRILTQKILIRCLNQSSELVSFFAVRILIIAFQKLLKVKQLLCSGASASQDQQSLWQEASARLVGEFTDRIPKMKDVIAAFRRTAHDDSTALRRESVTRLLRLYYDVVPLEAMEEQFDVSSALTEALVRKYSTEQSVEIVNIKRHELEHLLHIARYSPGMRWFSKQGALELSPIGTLLRLHSRDHRNAYIRKLIGHILGQNNIVSGETAVDVLVGSTLDLKDQEDINVWAFVDDCLARGSRKPVKYLDDLEAFSKNMANKEQHSSLLVMVLLEQSDFVPNKDGSSKIMAWAQRFLDLLSHSDEATRSLAQEVRGKISNLPKWSKVKVLDPGVWKSIQSSINLAQTTSETRNLLPEVKGESHLPFSKPPIESEDHPELLRWSKKDLDGSLEDGHVGALILCLCSEFPEVRSQAFVQINKLAEQLRNSDLDDKDSLFVLLGELMETYEQRCRPNESMLPYIAGTFAARALSVQLDPTHLMYSKLNRYLNEGPVWRMSKLPTYWLDHTVLSKPDQDDGYWGEVEWVVSWLIDGLRTHTDLELLRRAGIFERLMNLYASPGAALTQSLRQQILELLWRCTFVPGGGTTLVTRTGALTWLQMVGKKSEDDAEAAVRRRILETCDPSKVEQWSSLKIGELVAQRNI